LIYRFEDCALDTGRRELRCNGDLVAVEPQVFDLLHFLIANRNRIVTKDDLLNAIWGGRAISESAMTTRINAARHALSDSGESQRLLRTLRGKGFRFVGEVREDATHIAACEPYQELTFCRTSDNVNIAVATVGKGEVLVRAATWLNHVDYEWRSPVRLPLLRFLADRFRLVRYDGRGNGLSDWDVGDISFDGFQKDLDAVAESLGLERYALIGFSQGAPIAIAHAVRHPERVTKLVLHGAYAQGRNRRVGANQRETAQALLSIMRQGWGDEGSAFMRAFSSIYLPNGSREQIGWFADLQRMATSPENAARLRTACDDIDIADLLDKVRCPTLVLHSRKDGVVPFEEGRRLAASIPRAKFVLLDSDNHILLEDEPAWGAFISNIEGFLRAPDL
jgi:pimeloyl-ACP methyl ester carboxylesterase